MDDLEPKKALRGKDYAAACACFNIRTASRRITSLYNKHLKQTGLLISQLPLLVALDSAGPTPLLRLAEILDMDRTTLARNWMPLLREGLTTEWAGTDQRVRMLSITDKGRTALTAALARWEEAQREVVEAMGRDGYSSFLTQLAKIQTLGRD